VHVVAGAKYTTGLEDIARKVLKSVEGPKWRVLLRAPSHSEGKLEPEAAHVRIGRRLSIKLT
jgi:hypothetical protein